MGHSEITGTQEGQRAGFQLSAVLSHEEGNKRAPKYSDSLTKEEEYRKWRPPKDREQV